MLIKIPKIVGAYKNSVWKSTDSRGDVKDKRRSIRRNRIKCSKWLNEMCWIVCGFLFLFRSSIRPFVVHGALIDINKHNCIHIYTWRRFLFTFMQAKQHDAVAATAAAAAMQSLTSQYTRYCIYLLFCIAAAIDSSAIERKRVEMNLTRENEFYADLVSCVKQSVQKPIHRLHVLQWKCGAVWLLFFFYFIGVSTLLFWTTVGEWFVYLCMVCFCHSAMIRWHCLCIGYFGAIFACVQVLRWMICGVALTNAFAFAIHIHSNGVWRQPWMYRWLYSHLNCRLKQQIWLHS